MPVNDKIEALRKREAEIRAKIAAEESKRRKRDEKELNRIKLLVGGAFLADVEKNPDTRAGVVAVLDRAIVAPKDRDFLKEKGWL
jgi:hypothetical protein